jgi:SAM-dependent methyltransferase
MDAQAWDERYAAVPLVWSAGPNARFAELVGDWPPGRALDVACGEGRTAVWLAKRGWSVRAVDFSAVGVEKGRSRAAAEGVDVEWDVADVVTADLGEGYDLVAVLYLHLPEAEEAAVIRSCARALAPGGRLVFLGHARDNLERGVGGPQDSSVLPTPELLADWAGDLETEQCSHVDRDTPEGTAIDVLLVAIRPPAPEALPSGGSSGEDRPRPGRG